MRAFREEAGCVASWDGLNWSAAAYAAGPTQADKRLALSLGIDVYDKLPVRERLKKAVNYARAMASALRQLGLEATVEENLTRIDFPGQRFLARLQPGDSAALFFAGHGSHLIRNSVVCFAAY
jgi:Caspase domain